MGHCGNWYADGSACGLQAGGLIGRLPLLLLTMLVLPHPPTSCLLLLLPLHTVASSAWSAVAAFGAGFAAGTIAIAVLCNPCFCLGGGGAGDAGEDVASFCCRWLVPMSMSPLIVILKCMYVAVDRDPHTRKVSIVCRILLQQLEGGARASGLPVT